VQGRAVDFDHPRESPFSNSNAVSGSGNEKGERHSVNSSVSTTFSTFSSIYVETRAHVKSEERKEWELIPPRNQRLELDLRIDSERLSVNPLMPSARGRSASEVSQVSIGDFYDAYYRQSILAHRASVASQTQAIDVKMAGAGTELLNLANGGNGNGGLGMGGGKRPPPMNFSRGGAGIGLKPPGTIVELPSPLESPVLGKERFPTRI
jgi:hypothetical protein